MRALLLIAGVLLVVFPPSVQAQGTPPPSGGGALADIHWQGLNTDGTVLDDGGEIMLFSKTSGTWKINGLIGRDERHFGEVSLLPMPTLPAGAPPLREGPPYYEPRCGTA